MSRTERELVRARQEATRARSQLTGRLVEIQGRLKPSALIEELVEDLREKADELTQEGLALVKERPVATAGVAVTLLAWFFRGTLWDALIAAFSRDEATQAAPEEFQPGNRRTQRTRRNGG
ncbi:hypothetical protein [Sphingomonas cavernae]|uniref:DUF3618 domain-containing protein n=1 Tax=Sphingomonas cavernae TaxID=2320861 RepID=A0A418WMV9_9SPHN|nr:hypothetical protein [Sphingomonas cavernae]RJF91340.1 hypothetical protein D3876_14645 [Sphingomonas cavernae]